MPDHHNKLNYRLSHQEPHVYTVLRLNFTFFSTDLNFKILYC